jgi:sulfite exporter TauE/SafE
MTDPTTIIAALLAGLLTSVHCVGMCGPIACSIGSLQGGESRRLYAATAYHVGRLLAYGTVGALCGLVGTQVLAPFFDSPAVLLPWFLVGIFLLVATGLHRKLPRPAVLNRFLARARLRACRLSAAKGGFAMGLITPLLPCGPLYLLFGASLQTGSALRGAEFAAAFALGTIPLLWIAQHSFLHLRRWLSPLTLVRCQRGLALLAALVIAWRLHETIPFLESATSTSVDPLPGCGCD